MEYRPPRKKKRTAIPQKAKLTAELLQEVASRCPLCSSTDVGVFELHHIDEDPSNHEKINLLPVCPTCHAKIDKKEITMEMVRTAKISSQNRHVRIEFVSATINTEKCHWQQREERCFYESRPGMYDIPSIGFTIINHFPTTMVLKTIRMFVKHLPSGLSGIPQASLVKTVATYRLQIKKQGENIYPLQEPLQIPAGTAAKFETEVYSVVFEKDEVGPIGRFVLYFTFDFNADVSLTIPPIFLNSSAENDPLIVRMIG